MCQLSVNSLDQGMQLYNLVFKKELLYMSILRTWKGNAISGHLEYMCTATADVRKGNAISVT